MEPIWMKSLRKKVETGLGGCRHRLNAGLLVRPSALRDGNANQYARSRTIGLKVHGALELPQSFTHAANAYARALRLNFLQLRRRHAFALVPNTYVEHVFLAHNAYYSGFATRMPMNVG